MNLNIDNGVLNFSSLEISKKHLLSEVLAKNYLDFIARLDYSDGHFHRLVIKKVIDSNIYFDLAVYGLNDSINRIEVYLGRNSNLFLK